MIDKRDLPAKTKLVNDLYWAENYRCTGQFEVSQQMLDKALAQTQKDIHLSSYEDFALQYLGKLFFNLEKNVLALRHFNLALQIRLQKNDNELLESTKLAIKTVKNKIKKICVIGNSCSGKTTLSHSLKKDFSLTIFHVDSVQYLPGLKWRDPQDTRNLLSDISNQPEWIIDGLGPLKILEERMKKADLIIALRPPLKKIYWQLLKRQFVGLFKRRPELPENCFEATPAQTARMVRTIWNVNRGLWPQLDGIFKRDLYKDKLIQVFHVQDLEKLTISHANKN